MRVTLWADALEPNLGGIGRYTWELCKGLAQRADVEPRYFARNQLIADPGALVRGEPLPRRGRRFRRARAWLENRMLRAGIVHGPNYFLPSFADTGVITVHDLSVFRYPETHPVERRRAFEQEFHRSLSRASQIITDTDTVRDELIGAFGVPAEQVTAVHLGVDGIFRPRTPGELLKELPRMGLQAGSYALCISTMEPRKRIAELLAAWADLPAPLRDRFPVVLAGGVGWLNEDLLALVAQGVHAGWLKHFGFVAEGDLPALYSGAALFIYPSIYEGFGLPPLEAMASGTAVIVARRSCLPEVCGDAAGYFDPDSHSDMVDRITQALTDAQWRETAAIRGIERAKQFTWGKCIDETVTVYRRASGS